MRRGDGWQGRRANNPIVRLICHCPAYLPKLAGLGVADVPLLLPSVGLEGQLPGPRGRDDDQAAADPGRLLPVDVLPLRGPRYRGIRALQREPVTRAHERPGRPVLHDVEQSRQTSLLVPLAIDVLRNVGPVHHPVRRDALIPRRYSIERKLALVARDADAEGGRRVAAIDLAHSGIRIGAVAVIRDVAIVS